MSWSQVSEGRWERPATGLEGFFIVTENTSSSLCEGRRQFTICSRIDVNLHIPAPEVEDALRYAWKQLRYEQPQIAVTSEGYNKVYEEPDEASLQSWLDKTFIVSDEADGDLIGKKASPVAQATLYYLPKASQLVIRVSHSVIDGVGMVLVWDSYLKALMNPKAGIVFGGEGTRLPPSLEKALGYPDSHTPEALDKGVKVVLDSLSVMPGIGPVNRVGTVPAGPTQRREFVFSEQTTDAIVQACKKHGYSVTAAVHAAFVLVLAKHADPSQTTDETKYATVNNFNLRSYLPEPYNTIAAGVLYTIWPIILERPNSFNDAVHAIDEHYKTTFEGNPKNLAEFGTISSGLFEVVKTPEFWAAPPSRDALVSSLGIIERYLKHSYASADGSKQVTVEGFKFGTEIILGHSMFFFYTFRNTLRMVFSFNESYEDESSIQTYLEDVEKILLEELVA